MTNDIQNKLIAIIHYSTKNSLIEHFKTTFLVRFRYSGNIKNNEFEIWRLSHWFGSFYPVIHGRLVNNNGQLKLTLKTSLNSFGKFLCLLIMLAWTYSLIFGIIVQENNEWTIVWKRILVSIIIFIIPVLLFKLAYRYEKKKAIEEIRQIVKE